MVNGYNWNSLEKKQLDSPFNLKLFELSKKLNFKFIQIKKFFEIKGSINYASIMKILKK